MSVLKVVEILAESEKSWEDAAQSGIDKAAQTLRNIRSIYVKEMEAKVADGRITAYRINAKITFELE
ncbi:dodecin family protein [Methylotetracoccus oryzae]|uniref:dodecin family protein n=1 Tax=Methylotetracoccus oryzae TaxID=1919059 RepID=UPI00111AADD4|nr:dodecin family protein [Methylotetracoccus oryzae]